MRSNTTNELTINAKPRRTHARSGCRTCKLRKVKCDEGRPACRRCVSSNRTCSGYGIWGGGGNVYTHPAEPVHKERSLIISTAPIALFGASREERSLFDWFRTETRKNFPGTFALSFWKTLVLQASQQEPAVRHAVLCLSLVHKRVALGLNVANGNDDAPDELEQLMLQQYNKSIHSLAPHFASTNRESARIALITCLVFVAMEYLRGEFGAAETHLKNGIKVLSELQAPSHGKEQLLNAAFDPTDNSIFLAFSRMNIQLELFKQTHPHSLILLPDIDSGTPISVFNNRDEAWMHLERLMNKVFHLIQQGAELDENDSVPQQSPHPLIRIQQCIRGELKQWYATFTSSEQRIIGKDRGPCVSDLLINYFTVTRLMLETCLQPVDETVYDAYTQEFILIVKNSSAIFTRGFGPWLEHNSSLSDDISLSSADNGWVVPLYFTALKCRVHRVRVQAIRLIETLSHREGVLDSRISSSIARKVMEYEERDFYKDYHLNDEFDLSSEPGPEELSLPALPSSYRITTLKPELENNANGSVSVRFKQNQRIGGQLEVPIRKHGLFPYEKKQDSHAAGESVLERVFRAHTSHARASDVKRTTES